MENKPYILGGRKGRGKGENYVAFTMDVILNMYQFFFCFVFMGVVPREGLEQLGSPSLSDALSDAVTVR